MSSKCLYIKGLIPSLSNSTSPKAVGPLDYGPEPLKLWAKANLSYFQIDYLKYLLQLQKSWLPTSSHSWCHSRQGFYLARSTWSAMGFFCFLSCRLKSHPALPPTYTFGELCTHKSQKFSDTSPNTPCPLCLPSPLPVTTCAVLRGSLFCARSEKWTSVPSTGAVKKMLVIALCFLLLTDSMRSFLIHSSSPVVPCSRVGISHSHWLRCNSLTLAANNGLIEKGKAIYYAPPGPLKNGNNECNNLEQKE